MKRILSIASALLLCCGLQAQIIHSSVLNGGLLGAAAGAVIGHNSGSLHHNAWQGAALGAGAGMLLGSVVGEAEGAYTEVPTPSYPSRYGYYNGPRYISRDGYSVGYRRPVYVSTRSYGHSDYRGNGLFWGGLAGAIIGHNSGGFHHNAWRGAAFGAGAGYLLGSLAERDIRDEEPVRYIEETPVQSAPQQSEQPRQNVTIINNYYNQSASTPMSNANTLFGR